MKSLPAAVMLSVPVLLVATGRAQEIPTETRVESIVESIGMFKNGLAIVRRSVSLPATGIGRIDDLPPPVHGTFWIASSVPISATVTSREIEVPLTSSAGINFQEHLAGKQVRVHFRDGSIPPISGTVIESGRPDSRRSWNRTYQPPDYSSSAAYLDRDAMYGARPNADLGRFLIIETPTGTTFVDSGMIAHVAVDGKTVVKQRLPVLILAAEKPDPKQSKPVSVTITYLTKGIAWAPAYRVNLDDAKMLTIEQQAVIRNEMQDFRDAELHLISGFPSVQFAHVASPFSLETTWASFFAQLSQRFSPSRGVTAQAVSNVAIRDPGVDLSAIPSGEGVDLHYQPIGKRTMREGDSLMLTTGQGKAAYERIVEWTIPDDRDAHGRPVDRSQRSDERDLDQDAAWDAVRFKNPLPFPMTTAPAMVTANGQFNGQRQSFWVNTGEQSTLHITKALSIRTRHTEQEEQDKAREHISLGGRTYRRVFVKGQLDVNNHRKEAVTLVIRRQFSGDLIQADAKPSLTLAEEGAYSVNKRNQLVWTVPIEAGALRTINYQYSVLVIN